MTRPIRSSPIGVTRSGHGNRTFLVASSDWSEEPHLWRLANVSELQVTAEEFKPDPSFDLERYARRSFGTFQEDPVRVVVRFNVAAARDAAAFVFHSDQSVETNDEGSVTVRFEAGGIDEMCRHLFTWGESVTIEEPALRRLAELFDSLTADHRS